MTKQKLGANAHNRSDIRRIGASTPDPLGKPVAMT